MSGVSAFEAEVHRIELHVPLRALQHDGGWPSPAFLRFRPAARTRSAATTVSWMLLAMPLNCEIGIENCARTG